jgi:hypothetical protein
VDLKPDEREAQMICARWIDFATQAGVAFSLGAFLLYATGTLAPYVPLQHLPELWALPVGRFHEATGAPTGWGWLALISKGDYLNLAGVAWFALVILICYLRIIPLLAARGERLPMGLAIAQVVVLLASASGLFAGA